MDRDNCLRLALYCVREKLDPLDAALIERKCRVKALIDRRKIHSNYYVYFGYTVFEDKNGFITWPLAFMGLNFKKTEPVGDFLIWNKRIFSMRLITLISIRKELEKRNPDEQAVYIKGLLKNKIIKEISYGY